jgi:hypothetical protein
MDDMLTRLWTDLAARISGPMSFRFVLQPTMGALFAAIDGFKDAREGRAPYFWTIFTRPEERNKLLSEGWTRVLRIITLGVVMELIYQLRVLRFVYPGELILVVLGLCFLPYLLLRGTFNRIVRHWTSPARPSGPTRA